MNLYGVQIFRPNTHLDFRGSFINLWKADEQVSLILPTLKQINVSINNVAGTIRGLHYQSPPHEECKVVLCLKGAILDVLIDLRKDSPTFGKFMCIELKEGFEQAIFIPAMIAHGFQTLVDDTNIMYFHSASYCKSKERGIHPLDNLLKIPWKMNPTMISDRDLQLPSFQELVDEL